MDEMKQKYTPLCELPLVGRIFRNFDKNVGKVGFQGAMRIMGRETRSKITVALLSPYTEEVLRDKPTIVAVNHPHDIEMFPVIMGLPTRRDIYLIANSEALGTGPNTSKYIIPVYIHSHIGPKYQKIAVKFFKHFKLAPHYSYQEEHKRNIESIKYASEKINEGGLVVIMPTGVRARGKEWFPGIGYMMRDVKNVENAYYVMAYIKGTSKFDLLRVIPVINRLLPELKVYFSEPQKLSMIWDTEEPKIIAEKLQQQYYAWVKMLS